MPNGKRKKQPISQPVKRISITEKEFLDKMAHRMHPPVLSDNKTNQVRLLQKKEIDNFLSIPELARNFFHQKQPINPNCYARGIIASWVCTQVIYMNAYRTFIKNKNKKNLEAIQVHYQWLKENEETTRQFFLDFLKNPKDPKLNVDTQRILHGVIGHLANTIATYQLYYAISLYEQKRTIIDEIRSINEQSTDQINAMHLMMEEAEPRLIAYEADLFCPIEHRIYLHDLGIKMQIQKMRTLNTSILSLLSSVINPSACLTENLISKIAIPSSSTEIAPQRGLILTKSTIPLMIRHEWQKLFEFLTSNDQDPNMLNTDNVTEWVTNKTHLDFYYASLLDYAKNNHYDLDQDRFALMNPQKLPLEQVKQMIAHQRALTKIGLFVFDKIQKSDNQVIKNAIIFPLALHLYDLKSPLLALIDLAEHLKSGNAEWLDDNMRFFGSAFETIEPLLIKAGLSFILNQKIPGLDTTLYQFNQLNLISFFQATLQLYHHRLINQVSNGNLNKASGLRNNVNQLSTLIENNVDRILKITNQTQESINNKLLGMISLMKQSHNSCSFETDPGLGFLIALKQIEIPFDNSLVAVHSRDSLSPLALSMFFEKLQTIVADNLSLTVAFLSLEKEFSSLLVQCFGANKAYNIINAKQLILIFSFLTKYLQEDQFIDLCLIKIIRSLATKTYQSLNTWSDTLQHEKKTLLLEFERTLRDDVKNQRSYDTSFSKMQFQAHFAEPGFIMVAEDYFKEKKSQLTIPMLGILVHLTKNTEFSVKLHAELCASFYSEMLGDFSSRPYAEVSYYYEIINECLPLLIHYLKDIFNKDTLESFYFTIIHLKCAESRYYFYNGFPDKALTIQTEASEITEACSMYMSQNNFDKCQHNLLLLKEEISNPSSPPNLLAFMRNPEASPFNNLEPIESLFNSFDSEEPLMDRFYRVYYFLIYSTNQQQRKDIYQTWKRFFSNLDQSPLTKELLLSHWNRHHAKCEERHRASNPTQSKVEGSRPSKAIKSAPARVKIDWSQIEEERHLQTISLFNETRTKTLAKRRQQKQAQKEIAALQYNAANSGQSIDLEPETAMTSTSQTDIKPMAIPASVITIMSNIKKQGYEVYIVGGYVRDQLLNLPANDIDLFTNCPALELNALVSNLIPNKKFNNVFYLSIENEQLGMDIKSIAFESMHDLVNHFDFTINAFILDCEGQVHAPLPQSYTDLNNKQIKPIKPGMETFINDNARIWRLIRLANQLNWELAKEEKDLIKTLGSRLCDLPFSQFYTQFNRCFTKNIEEGRKNFNTFQELGLFHHFLMINPQNPLNNNDFCLTKYNELFNKNPDYRFIDSLALFFILAKESSFKGYQNNITQWIEHFETREHHPGIIASLKKELPLRVAHYNRLRLYNVDAPLYNPYDTPASHLLLSFMTNQAATPTCSSDHQPGALLL